MGTECYAMVRGSGIRVTDLDARGSYDDEAVRYGTSNSVVRITINEVTEQGGNDLVRNQDEEPRLHFVTNEQTVRYETDIEFLRCDPSLLNILTKVPLAFNAQGDIVGFDATTRLPVKSFGLEVWSKLIGYKCVADVMTAGFGEMNFGEDAFGDGSVLPTGKPYGYTLFPWLRGGTIGGFAFANGLVSFNIRGARTTRGSKWGYGPYDLEGPYMRLLKPVSRNTMWKTLVSTGAPPYQEDGVIEYEDVIHGGNASASSADILDGNTGPWIVSGGAA